MTITKIEVALLALVFRRPPREQSPAEFWSDGVVHLYQNNGGDSVVSSYEAEGGAAGVEGLGDDDAADYGCMNFWRGVVGEEAVAGGVVPTPIQSESEEQDVAPIDEQRGAVVDELRQQRCREWSERDGTQKGDVNPGEIAVGAGEVVELGLLSDPEDAVGHDAHQKNEQSRREADQRVPEIVLGVDGLGGGDAQVENEQGHGDGEETVAEGGDAVHILSGNAVVEGVHRKEFSG